ncbi:transporter substrate-binding domain-containing protein [Mesorhizobium sp. M8A.F.Ca.ET.059.01.1.1]|nr:transporter substrate-binding domain-containing protein [Mesorhizobium sp. M8A.F.Ca.ET.059.01.1.1]
MTMYALKTLAFSLALGLGAAVAHAETLDCGDDTLCKIEASKVLKVGTKDDYKPWSYRAPDGSFAGMEVDLANALGELLGAKVEIVKVNSANRFEFLAQGQIDLMIASATDTAERRQVVGFVHPNYYSSGYNILLPKKVTATKWEEMAGQTICAIQGAWYNKPAQEKFKIELLAFAGNAEVDSALQQGRCIGVLSDDNLINVQLADAKWADYHMPLPTQDDAPWGIAVRKADLDKPWGVLVAGAIANWHRSGKLLELEKANGIAESAYLRKMHEALKDHLPAQ